MTNRSSIRMTNLFRQLGLDASPEGIEKFIAENKLKCGESLAKAEFWNDSQRQLLDEWLHSDGEWSLIVDQLSEALREE
ncbi:MAG TPA: DUF2789 family protein [Alcanivoracaceae bacterium]|nr:DUF2789 family protein [Alcanivoracaceae bacterium]